MSLILETDLGRDPDDFFSICYLAAANVDIETILITPGDPDQIAIAKFLVSFLGLNANVLASQYGRNKKSSGGIHYKILNKYNYPLEATPDGYKEDVTDIQNKDLLVIGPPTATGDILQTLDGQKLNDITVQGGFIGYDVHGLPCQRLEKFEDKKTVSTFNLGGAAKQAQILVKYPYKHSRKFVSKNLCHTIVYTKEIHEIVKSYKCDKEPIKLLIQCMDMYLKSHPNGKKFHDPTAAVCHLHPEIATWVRAKLYSEKNQWGAKLSKKGDSIIVDIDRDKLWECIANGK